jgi:peptidoglycan/xylan/chitin deacetylase (PgdA/CDA1 family)
MSDIEPNNGLFVISLDFELMWGVWDVTTTKRYGKNITGVQQVIPSLLHIFEQYQVKATFATVGFLFCKDKDELFATNPHLLPAYSNDEYNVYKKELPIIGNDEQDDPYHFGYSLFEQLKESNQEIGTHTYSHYYCLEDGQTAEQFDADIKAAKLIAYKKGVVLNSFVFPRNQVNEEYLEVLAANNINVYRGNPTSWIYKPRRLAAEIYFIRLCRLLDTYLPVSGYNTHSLQRQQGLPINIPASRFLKPYAPKLKWLEKLRMHRIKKEMTKAAQKKELYHLWWHPHNFGVNLEQNIAFLTALLDHYKLLQKKYGFASVSMNEAASIIQKQA